MRVTFSLSTPKTKSWVRRCTRPLVVRFGKVSKVNRIGTAFAKTHYNRPCRLLVVITKIEWRKVIATVVALRSINTVIRDQIQCIDQMSKNYSLYLNVIIGRREKVPKIVNYFESTVLLLISNNTSG